MVQMTQQLPGVKSNARSGSQPHRLRSTLALATVLVAAFGLAGAQGLDWSAGSAMVIGELIGLLAPLAVVALAVFVLHFIWTRIAG